MSVGNLCMLVLVGLVAAIVPVPANFKSLIPVGFWAPEATIVVFSGLLSMWQPTNLMGAFKKMVVSWKTNRNNDQLADAARGATLFCVYAAQLFALDSLLMATGGPIHSPYVPLALVTVIFTPFLANNPVTVVVVLVVTAACYTFVVVGYGSRKGDVSAWVYAGVNLLIVAVAVLPSLGELLRAERLKEVLSGVTENGGVSVEDVPAGR